ncbi:MAG: hypothetical protein RI973_276 [Bacteroidota bacterium]|jgi:predicted flap endonuclease-1-like 5' DNA nuclease
MLKKSYSKTKPVCKVTFSLPLEAAKGGNDVRVLGDFNGWSWENGYPMAAGKKEFTAEAEIASGRDYEFRYLIDNHIWENDWQADAYVSAAFGTSNSVLSLKAEEKAAPVVKARAAAEAKADQAKPAPAAKAASKPAASKAAAPKPAPAKATAVKPAAADDLTKIEGVGPKIAELLQQAGIATFADLAKAKTADLKKILEAAGKRFLVHDPATWAEQAKLAAKADWEKLGKLQATLKGGK